MIAIDAVTMTEERFAHLEIIELTEAIVMDGGKKYAGLSKAGKKIEFNSCLIAATARSLGMSEIGTRNTDHFNRITGVAALVPEDCDF